MKIDLLRTEDSNFQDLKPGDAFWHDRRLFIKAKHHPDAIGVELCDGETLYFNGIERVARADDLKIIRFMRAADVC